MDKNVLILDGSIHRDAYSPTAGWRRYLGAIPSRSAHLPSGEAVPELAPFTHLILTGSEASIVEHQPWYDRELEAVRAAIARGMPVLASCFGHQLLALALSGPQHVARAQCPELGWIEVEVTADDPLLAGIPRPFRCFTSHFDEVRDPPAPWRVLARSPHCAVQIMRYGAAPVWGVQPHPEILPEEGVPLLRKIIEKMPEQAHRARAALEQEVRDDFLAGTLVENFLAAS
jgi:GMP synthase-like glutamine amidotransferase